MMGLNKELAKKAEKIAREICKERNISEAMWELVLPEAYRLIQEGK